MEVRYVAKAKTIDQSVMTPQHAAYAIIHLSKDFPRFVEATQEAYDAQVYGSVYSEELKAKTALVVRAANHYDNSITKDFLYMLAASLKPPIEELFGSDPNFCPTIDKSWVDDVRDFYILGHGHEEVLKWAKEYARITSSFAGDGALDETTLALACRTLNILGLDDLRTHVIDALPIQARTVAVINGMSDVLTETNWAFKLRAE